MEWRVHKFGGTSVGNAQRYKGVAQIIKDLDRRHGRGIVVSAMKGVTDKLIETVTLAQKRDDAYVDKIAALKQLHLDTIAQLLKEENRRALIDAFDADFRDLQEILRGIRLSGIASEKNAELVSGYGEVWSAQLLNAYLRESGHASEWLDARHVLVVESFDRSVTVDWEKSSEKMKAWLKKHPADLVVITGFVASTHDGVATTLKRNGSDFSASIFGALLDATEITIWTDVDGVFSADPRLVPEAVVLDELSYSEISEMAFFGAKVVHPATMGPAMKKGIPIWIRNTFNPTFPGTKIHFPDKSNKAHRTAGTAGSAGPAASAATQRPAKGFSTIDQMALINIEGNGMVGVPGVAERLFSALCRADVSVVMISQASSEHSICLSIPQAQADVARKAIETAFYAELHQGLIERIEVTPDCSILAIVGDNMIHHPGLAGRFFRALGQAGVSVKAIAQGSSERNISAVISQKDNAKALRSAHSAFYLSDQTLSIGIIGSGLIGRTLLNQLRERISHLKTERQIDLRIRAVMNSKKMVLDDRHIDLGNWENLFQEKQTPSDLARFEEHLKSGHFPHNVIIDATASEDITRNYSRWLAQGFNIISPNKKANTAAQSYYEELRNVSREKQKYFIYSTNVGAGLPVIQTLRDLHHTGDKVISIEGILSGTLSYIFNVYTGDTPFSEIVKEARLRGYTEPDPRDDLSGMDVARKLVILAREMGLKLELDDVDVQSLVPGELRQGSVDDFLSQLPRYDDGMKKLVTDHKNKSEVLRYVGTIDENGKIRVQLKAYPAAHAFTRITGSDNIVAFRTRRYDKQPLIIQGPGAGPDVTAAGVFADILRLASYLGAPF